MTKASHFLNVFICSWHSKHCFIFCFTSSSFFISPCKIKKKNCLLSVSHKRTNQEAVLFFLYPLRWWPDKFCLLLLS